MQSGPSSLRSAETCTLRLFSSTTMPGQTSASNSFLPTTRSRCSIRHSSRSRARAPSGCGSPPRSTRRSPARTSNAPSTWFPDKPLSRTPLHRDSVRLLAGQTVAAPGTIGNYDSAPAWQLQGRHVGGRNTVRPSATEPSATPRSSRMNSSRKTSRPAIRAAPLGACDGAHAWALPPGLRIAAPRTGATPAIAPAQALRCLAGATTVWHPDTVPPHHLRGRHAGWRMRGDQVRAAAQQGILIGNDVQPLAGSPLTSIFSGEDAAEGPACSRSRQRATKRPCVALGKGWDEGGSNSQGLGLKLLANQDMQWPPPDSRSE